MTHHTAHRATPLWLPPTAVPGIPEQAGKLGAQPCACVSGHVARALIPEGRALLASTSKMLRVTASAWQMAV